MRICYVLPTSGIAGGVNIIIEHATRLMQRGHEVFFLQCDSNRDLSWYPNCIVPSYSIHYDESIRFYMSKPVDVVIATGWQTVYEILRRQLPALAYAYFFQANEKNFYPQDCTEHDLAAFTATLPFEYYTEATWICELLHAKYGRNVFYARHGINRELFHPADPIIPKSDKVRILLEGPMSQPRKRMDDAFLAVDGLDAEIWLVTSDGDLKPWQKTDMTFKKVPISQMKNIYSACDILVKLPTVEGVFGPPLEMMACGGTCVTSDVLGHDEYITNGYNAFVVPMGDFRAAKVALQRLIDDPSLLTQMKRNGLKTASEFPWEPTIDNLEQHFQNLVKESSKRSIALNTETVWKYLNLSQTQRLALRLYLRRYFEIAWNMGAVDAVLRTDKIIDSEILVPTLVQGSSILHLKGWAFNRVKNEACRNIRVLTNQHELNILELKWCQREDLVGFIGTLASHSGFLMKAVLPRYTFANDIEVKAEYLSGDVTLELWQEDSEVMYGVLEEMQVFTCYEIVISERVLKYPEGFCVTLNTDKTPAAMYIGFSEKDSWNPTFAVANNKDGTRAITIDDIHLLAGVMYSGKANIFIWLPQETALNLAIIEPNSGTTLI